MIAKKNVLHSQFQSTLKFQNMNIYNINNTKLDQFKGYVSMDTKKLDRKKNVIYDGIYYQATNMDPISPIKRDFLFEQVIDYGDFQSSINTNTNNNTQSNLTLNTNSISKVSENDSNSYNNSSSQESNSCN